MGIIPGREPKPRSGDRPVAPTPAPEGKDGGKKKNAESDFSSYVPPSAFRFCWGFRIRLPDSKPVFSLQAQFFNFLRQRNSFLAPAPELVIFGEHFAQGRKARIKSFAFML